MESTKYWIKSSEGDLWVMVDMVNDREEFKWRMRTDDGQTDWEKWYDGILVLNTKLGPVALVTACWDGTFEGRSEMVPFLCQFGQVVAG